MGNQELKSEIARQMESLLGVHTTTIKNATLLSSLNAPVLLSILLGFLGAGLGAIIGMLTAKSLDFNLISWSAILSSGCSTLFIVLSQFFFKGGLRSVPEDIMLAELRSEINELYTHLKILTDGGHETETKECLKRISEYKKIVDSVMDKKLIATQKRWRISKTEATQEDIINIIKEQEALKAENLELRDMIKDRNELKNENLELKELIQKQGELKTEMLELKELVKNHKP
jgi:hypothetical protein